MCIILVVFNVEWNLKKKAEDDLYCAFSHNLIDNDFDSPWCYYKSDWIRIGPSIAGIGFRQWTLELLPCLVFCLLFYFE